MRRLLGLRDLVHDAVDTISQLVQDTQEASWRKPVALLSQFEPLGEPLRAVDGVRAAATSAVFTGIRLTNRTVQRIGDGAIELAGGIAEALAGRAAITALQHAVPPRSLTWADVAQGALNATLGDFLHARDNGLATAMGFYHERKPLQLAAHELAHALPEATDKLCIFVHGLAGTELAWWMGALEYHGDASLSLGTLLARDRGYTPLYVRYNTGRHVSENGRELSRIIAQLVAAYPLKVREIALVGHSMGGLLGRSAAHYGQIQDEPWIRALTHVLCIGSPHTGAFLEKSTNLLTSLLGYFDVAGTQVPARILNARSAGIKDLRFGYVTDEDWTGRDPDALLSDSRHDVPLLQWVIYGFMASTFVKDPSHPLGALLGDLLVRVPSASGKASDAVRDVSFHIGSVLHGLHHLALLNHPEVYRQLLEFLSKRPLDPDSGKP